MAIASECLVLTERLDAIQGKGFKGPPHYFCNNTDQDEKKRNMAEFSRRRSLGLFFNCTPFDPTKPIHADAGSGIEDSGGSTAAAYGSGAAADKAAAAGSRDGLPGGPTEVASGAAAGDVAVPGPSRAVATPSCKEAHSRGATAADGTAPAGGDGQAADKSNGRPIHHCSNPGQG